MFVWKAATNSASPFIPAAEKRKRRKASTSPKEVSNPVSAGLPDVCCTPEFCCDTCLERDKLSLTWEALNEKLIFLLGHNLTGDQNFRESMKSLSVSEASSQSTGDEGVRNVAPWHVRGLRSAPFHHSLPLWVSPALTLRFPLEKKKESIVFLKSHYFHFPCM